MGKKDTGAAFRPEVREVVRSAKREQRKMTRQLKRKADKYVGSAPKSTGAVQEELGSASGRTFPQYVSGTERRFFGGTTDVTNAYRQVLRNFQPNILGSRSQTGLDSYLGGLRRAYGSEIQQQGLAGRERLSTLPEEARTAFTLSEQNPAFNNLRNEQYMSLAQDPPTVSNDAMAMYRSLFTYNV
jgi:hypothetical protein